MVASALPPTGIETPPVRILTTSADDLTSGGDEASTGGPERSTVRLLPQPENTKAIQQSANNQDLMSIVFMWLPSRWLHP